MGKVIEVVVKSDEFVCWAQEVKEAAEKLQGLLENMPRSVKAAVVGQSERAND